MKEPHLWDRLLDEVGRARTHTVNCLSRSFFCELLCHPFGHHSSVCFFHSRMYRKLVNDEEKLAPCWGCASELREDNQCISGHAHNNPISEATSSQNFFHYRVHAGIFSVSRLAPFDQLPRSQAFGPVDEAHGPERSPRYRKSHSRYLDSIKRTMFIFDAC